MFLDPWKGCVCVVFPKFQPLCAKLATILNYKVLCAKQNTFIPTPYSPQESSLKNSPRGPIGRVAIITLTYFPKERSLELPWGGSIVWGRFFLPYQHLDFLPPYDPFQITPTYSQKESYLKNSPRGPWQSGYHYLLLLVEKFYHPEEA